MFIVILAKVLTVALTIGIWALIRRLLPVTTHRAYSPLEMQALATRHQWINFVGQFYVLIQFPFAAAAWIGLFFAIASVNDLFIPPHVLLVRFEPLWHMWIMPAVFLGLISSGWSFSLACRLIFDKKTCDEMTAVVDFTASHDTRRFLRWLTIIVPVLSMGWLAVTLDWCTRLDEEHIVISPFCQFHETSYSYLQVRALVEATHLRAPAGNLVQRRRQFVIFDDGEIWCHDNLLQDSQPLMQFLEAKTQKSFKQVRFIEDFDK